MDIKDFIVTLINNNLLLIKEFIHTIFMKETKTRKSVTKESNEPHNSCTVFTPGFKLEAELKNNVLTLVLSDFT